MKRWWVVIALLLSVGVNIGLLAAIFAARHQGLSGSPGSSGSSESSRSPGAAGAPEEEPRQPPAVERLQRLADRLGLQGVARRRFVATQRIFFQDTARDRRRLGAVNRELRLELTGDSPDPQRVERLTAESAELYRTLERALAGNVLETRKLLAPEQERTYLDLIRQLRPGRGPFATPNGPPAAPWRRGLDQPRPPAR